MEDWQQRIINERIQLVERIEAIRAWLHANKERSVDHKLLISQLYYMIEYVQVLNLRIERFK